MSAVEAVGDVFWLKLQDYIPSLDREDWEDLVASITPELEKAIRSDLDPDDAATQNLVANAMIKDEWFPLSVRYKAAERVLKALAGVE